MNLKAKSQTRSYRHSAKLPMRKKAEMSKGTKLILKTKLTEQYGVDLPFVNAGMAFIATSGLAAAVARAGGLGTIGCAAMSPDFLRDEVRRIRSATNRSFGVDIIPRFSPPEHIDVLAQEKVPLVIFFWDEVPDEWTSKLRAAGTKIWMQIGSVSEAKRAIAQGVDGLVVQGSAAGGHNRSSAELISLLPAVRDLDDDMLLIAAGGIADGRSAAAALALGADGVWVGTRLLASVESAAHSEYKRRVLAAGVDDTVRHNVFGPEFPDATVRGLRNRVVKEWEGRDYPAPYKDLAPETLPIIGEADIYGQKVPMTRFCGFPPTEKASGDFEEMSLLAGESVGQTNELLGVEEIVTTMMSDAAAIIGKRLGAMVAGS
jgi:enoyl-[acyl-carrier protein] reductase II